MSVQRPVDLQAFPPFGHWQLPLTQVDPKPHCNPCISSLFMLIKARSSYLVATSSTVIVISLVVFALTIAIALVASALAFAARGIGGVKGLHSWIHADDIGIEVCETGASNQSGKEGTAEFGVASILIAGSELIIARLEELIAVVCRRLARASRPLRRSFLPKHKSCLSQQFVKIKSGTSIPSSDPHPLVFPEVLSLLNATRPGGLALHLGATPFCELYCALFSRCWCRVSESLRPMLPYFSVRLSSGNSSGCPSSSSGG